MEWITLTLFAAYLILGFGARAVIAYRRTGDHGFRSFRRRPGTAAWWAALLLLLGVLAAIVGPIAGLLGLPAIPLLDHWWVPVVGLFLALTGIVGTLAAQLAMGNSWRVGVDPEEQTQLVTSGPFGWTRNPILLAALIAGAGLALLVPNVISGSGWLILWAAVELQVRGVEEPYLRSQHPDEYASYCSRVGRFLPGLGLR